MALDSAPHPYLSREYPLRLAHRGSRELWPENTMMAFQGAVDLGYRYIETDVQLTADDVVVVFHDNDLDRLTNANGPIRQWRWDDVRHLDAAWSFAPDEGYPLRASGCHLSTLEEVLIAYPDISFNIDMKCRGAEWPVADVIKRLGRDDTVLVAGSRDGRTARFRRLTGGRVATSAGAKTISVMWAASRVGRTIRRPVVAYQVPYDYTPRLDRRFVDAVHEAGAHVHAWTVNDSAHMEALLDLGVDGIVTDRPDVLNDVLAARGDHG